MLETAEVRAEIKAIVESKGRWQPPVLKAQDHSNNMRSTPGADAASSQGRSRVQTSPIISVERLTSSSSTSSGSHPDLEGSPPSEDVSSPQQPRRAFSSSLSLGGQESSTPTRSSFRLPLLHSQITNVEIRHANLSSTLLTRSGKTLDKLVDVAAPLRGLGGPSGPVRNKTDAQGGAVPDEMLDVQDRLEEDAQKAGAGIKWCRLLEEQWRL